MSCNETDEIVVREEVQATAIGRRDLLRFAGALGLTSSVAALAACASSGNGGGITRPQFAVARELGQRIAASRTELQTFSDRVERMSTQLESGASLGRAAGEFAQAYPELQYGGPDTEPTALAIVVIIIIILILIPIVAK